MVILFESLNIHMGKYCWGWLISKNAQLELYIVRHVQFKVRVQEGNAANRNVYGHLSWCCKDGRQEYFGACLTPLPRKVAAAARGKVEVTYYRSFPLRTPAFLSCL